MWQAWTNGLLGAWIFISAFMEFSPTLNLWNDLVIGAIVAYVSYTILKDKPWQAWLGIIMGLWLVVAAFIPAMQVGSGYLWNDVISGTLLMIAGFAAVGGGKGVVE